MGGGAKKFLDGGTALYGGDSLFMGYGPPHPPPMLGTSVKENKKMEDVKLVKSRIVYTEAVSDLKSNRIEEEHVNLLMSGKGNV